MKGVVLRLRGTYRGVGKGGGEVNTGEVGWLGWEVMRGAGVGGGGVEGHCRERRGLSAGFIADSSLPPSLWQMDFHNAETM